jgi:hypothetical protein
MKLRRLPRAALAVIVDFFPRGVKRNTTGLSGINVAVTGHDITGEYEK